MVGVSFLWFLVKIYRGCYYTCSMLHFIAFLKLFSVICVTGTDANWNQAFDLTDVLVVKDFCLCSYRHISAFVVRTKKPITLDHNSPCWSQRGATITAHIDLRISGAEFDKTYLFLSKVKYIAFFVTARRMSCMELFKDPKCKHFRCEEALLMEVEQIHNAKVAKNRTE